jgi:hypothetical protein
MTTQNTQSGQLGDLARFSTALEENVDDLPTMALAVAALQVAVGLTQEAAMRQAALARASREATREFQDLLRESSRLATGLRVQVKYRYGISSLKLVEFGIQPFQGRKSPKPNPPVPVEPVPTNPDGTPVE